RSPSVLEQLKSDENIDLKQLELDIYEENQQTLSNFLPAELMEQSKIISVTQNNSTGLLTFIASSTDKPLNEKLAKYYFEKLTAISFVDKESMYDFAGMYKAIDMQIVKKAECR